MAKIFTKLNVGDTVATSGTRVFKKLTTEEPGLPIWNGTDLLNTIWTIKSGWSAEAGYGEFDIGGLLTFRKNFMIASVCTLRIGYEVKSVTDTPYTSANSICWDDTPLPQQSVESTRSRSDTTEEIQALFTSGTDTTNPRLIDWMIRNADLVSHQPAHKGGLYDANDNLVASWNKLVYIYGMDAGYHYYDWETNPASPYNVLKNNSELSSGTKLVITNAMTYISDGAFRGCANLTQIVIPDGMTGISARAFYDCTNLKFNEYDNGLYLGSDGNPYLCFVKPINTDITNCVIHEKAMVFADHAFSFCESLTNMVIPHGVEKIAIGMFVQCSSLVSITIPVSVKEIPNGAIMYCDSLTDIYYRGTEEQWNEISIHYLNDLNNATIHYNYTG